MPQFSRACCRLSRSEARQRSLLSLQRSSPFILKPPRRFSVAAGGTSGDGGSLVPKIVALGVCFAGGMFFQKSFLSSSSSTSSSSSSSSSNKQNNSIDPKYLSNWELYYWPFIGGRGMYPRMLFLLAGAEWNEPARDYIPDENEGFHIKPIQEQRGHDNPLYPCWAPPIIIHNKSFLLSQTPAIMLHLSKLFNLQPENEEDYAHGIQIMLQVLDLLCEAEKAYHPVHPNKSYKSQFKEAQPKIEFFLKERLPKQLRIVQEALIRSPDADKSKKGEKGWFYGCKEPTFVDASVAMFMRGYETSQKEHYDNNKEFELLKQHQKRFESIETIANYLNDPKRRPPIDDNSFMG